MIDHFGFKSRPFTRELPIRQCISFPFLDEQVKELTDAVNMRMSALLMAPPGQGKTVILRKVRDQLPETRFKVSYIKVTRLSGRDLCREISRAIGAKSAGSYPALVRAAQERMEEVSSSQGIRVVVILDDAHALRDQGFELLKILSNFDMDSKLIVSFILAGHQDLRQRLEQSELVDVKQRIIHFGQLRLLSREECVDYIQHRLHLVGCSNNPFDENALEIIFEMSRGNMRAIDNLALKSLGYAAGKQEKTVSGPHVAKAGASLWN